MVKIKGVKKRDVIASRFFMLCEVSDQFKKLKGYHSYYGHEYVSTHIACHFLIELGYEWEFIEKVLMITDFHMKMLHGGEEAVREIYHYCGDVLLLLWEVYH
ncbi:hypothetical protein [Bacillus sp. H1a]|uniref:hypothetical protein n=1 Tax=Bacillus sp. H1a TaxID=1397276 RepID=UPI000A584152|nr:hypothetical protein [Bacillus sp. H1a]